MSNRVITFQILTTLAQNKCNYKKTSYKVHYLSVSVKRSSGEIGFPCSFCRSFLTRFKIVENVCGYILKYDRNLSASSLNSFCKRWYFPNSSLLALMGCTGYFLLLPNISLFLRYVEVSRHPNIKCAAIFASNYTRLSTTGLSLLQVWEHSARIVTTPPLYRSSLAFRLRLAS